LKLIDKMKFGALASLALIKVAQADPACAIADVNEGGSGNWNAAATWNNAVGEIAVPRPGDDVTIGLRDVTVPSGYSAVAKSVTVTGSSILTVEGTLTVGGGDVSCIAASLTPTSAPTRAPTDAPTTKTPTSTPTLAPTPAPSFPDASCIIGDILTDSASGVPGTTPVDGATGCSDTQAFTIPGTLLTGQKCGVRCDYTNDWSILSGSSGTDANNWSCEDGVVTKPTLRCSDDCVAEPGNMMRSAQIGGGPQADGGFLFQCKDISPAGVSGSTDDELASGVVTIVLLDSNGTQIDLNDLPVGEELNFVIPFESEETRSQLEPKKGDCTVKELQCEWWDTTLGAWNDKGCTTVAEDVTTPKGSGVQCSCSHTTDFALVVRKRKLKKGEGTCPADTSSESDMLKIALYGFVLLGASTQAIRGSFNDPRGKCKVNCPAAIKDLLVRQHLGIALVCLLRIVSEIANSDVGVALMFGVVATYTVWLVFLSLVTKWTEIAVFSMSQKKNPMRVPFIMSAILMGLVSVGVAVATLSAADKDQIEMAIFGGYATAAVAMVCGVVVSVVGFQLAMAVDGFAGNRTGTTANSTKGSTGGKKGNSNSLAFKLRVSAVLFSLGFVTRAILEALVLQNALDDPANPADGLDYGALFLEIFILLTFIYLFSAGISKSATLCGSSGNRSRTGTGTTGTAGSGKKVEMAEA
jgi:hypothetical protein